MHQAQTTASIQEEPKNKTVQYPSKVFPDAMGEKVIKKKYPEISNQ